MRQSRSRWRAALFFAGSLRAIATGGMFGFWAEHIRNDWNNQIFIDLLLSASCAYFLLLAMIARVLFLERKAASRAV